MMLSISRKTVRQTWRPYAGAFVALACGVVLISVAVTLIGAVEKTARRAGITADEKLQLDDLAAMFGMMSGVALFMAMFVVASTFGFVVASRRRELGMLRLIGATPRQVRRMVAARRASSPCSPRSWGACSGLLSRRPFPGCCEHAGSPTSRWTCRHRGSPGWLRCPAPPASR